MIEKEYYRVDELATLGVTEGTIRYFVEQNKLTPTFFAPATDYILGGLHKNKFHGFAKANYKGLISLPKHCLSELLKKGKTRSNTVNLIQKENIVIKSADYPFSINYPNNFLESWLSFNPVKPDWHSVPAKHFPTEQDSGWSVFADLVKSFTDDEKEKAEFDKVYSSGKPKRVLNSYGVEFTLSDLCIRHQDLLNLGVIHPKVNQLTSIQPPVQEKAAEATPIDFDNEFEELLAKILRSKSRIQAKNIHRILCDECAREEDSRLFDHKNILVGDDQGIISWRDKFRGNAERSYTLDSLRNVVSKVRKKLRQ